MVNVDSLGGELNLLKDKITTFDWEQLEGKTLKIIIGKDTTENGETIMVSGYDKTDNKIYILHCVQKGDHLV